MRFLGLGESCDLGEMYQRLGAAGHEVRVFVENSAARDVFAGMLHFTTDWRAELAWLRAAGRDGIALFESVAMGEIQDELRRDGFQVIGGSAYGDRLESDREFGQQVLRGIGLNIAASHGFENFEDAIAFVTATPGRYVLKNNGSDPLRTRNYVGELDDGSDILALLSLYRAQEPETQPADFVLMEHVAGVEVGVGAYFNGRRFLEPVCLDWEHKHFFPGDLGELTSEMGTVVTYTGGKRIFELTLARMSERLRAGGYCGYINLNLIANERGLWPLEFTSRFGYPGYAICEALHAASWDSIFKTMAGGGTSFAVRDGYAVGIVLTVPPFPYSYGYAHLSKGAPVLFRATLTDAQRRRLHFAEVAMADSRLITSGNTGYVGVATGVGATIGEARHEAIELAQQVVVANLRYRNDIGVRVAEHDLGYLYRLGYLPDKAYTSQRLPD
ncbi:MAG: phosphoribosylamine--glycine ligase [Burkholderiales bacterium]